MNKIQYLNNTELQTLCQNQEVDKSLVFIDVRTPGEHQSGHIPNSINIPLDQIASIDNNTYKDKTVVFYCRSGARTTNYEHILEMVGAKKMLCISGGIMEWVSNGFPVTL